MKRLDLTAIIYEGSGRPTPWVVEAIDDGREGDEGAVYMARFTGPGAEAAAEEYAREKYQTYDKKPLDWPRLAR